MTTASSALWLLAHKAGLLAFRCFTRPAKWRKHARNSRALAVMDERLLRDIGLSRAEREAQAERLFFTAPDA